MNTIENTFSKDKFFITKIKYEHNSPSKDIIIRLNRYEYEINYHHLKRILDNFNIDLDSELHSNRYPIERLDNRPLYKKSIDFQMGRRVDFNNSKHYVPVNLNYLKNELEKAYAEIR